MLSQPAHHALDLLKALKLNRFKSAPAMRFGALAVVAIAATTVGPSGFAVGPTQSHTQIPALATGGAMEARVVLASIPMSFDIMPTSQGLITDHTSYAERTVGELRFPEGAVDVPWADPVQTDDAGDALATAIPSRGGSVSRPTRDDTPQLMAASFGTTDFSTRDVIDPSSLRSVIMFDRSAADLRGNAEDLLAQVAASLRGTDIRVQLRAFGGGIAERSHTARRLALRRALSVRNYLMEQGVDQERITVRAMGGATDGGPSDRVDIVLADS